MGWVIQIAATFIAAILMIFILWLIYKGFTKVFPNIKQKFKFGLMKKKLTDEENEFLRDCLEEDINDSRILAALLLQDPTGIKRADEMLYIYNKMKKGGGRNGRR